MYMAHRIVAATALTCLFGASVSCGVSGKIGAAACPALGPDAATLDTNFTSDPRANGKIRAFVQAAKDITWASGLLEAEVGSACRRIGVDLGISPHEMQPRKGPGGAAAGPCDVVAARIDAILRQGIRPWVTVVPPTCQANASAYGRCSGVCDVNSDAECNASCRAHANVHAACEPAQVSVRASDNAAEAAALISTLQANLPALVHAQMALGHRLLGDAKVLAQVGASLPKLVGNAGGQALACVGAAADAAASATVRINVSVRASTNITARVGGG